MEQIKHEARKSEMLIGEPYFWTSTINGWRHLLKDDKNKDILISSLHTLTERKLIEVYGFVIMPNHIHILWKSLKLNGKEKPNASFQKYTAHSIGKELKSLNSLQLYQVNECDRDVRIWQRDPLAVALTDKKMVEQKLDYIHNNPLQEHWNLTKRPEDYKYSSAGFYEAERNDWPFLVDYREKW